MKNYQKFNKQYRSLSNIHQEIVWELMRNLQHDLNVNEKLEVQISDTIKKYKKKYGYTLETICDMIQDENENISESTLKYIIRNNSINKNWNKYIAEAFNITEEELCYEGNGNYEDKIRNLLLKMSANICNVELLFESLTKKEQEAVLALVRSLYMEENCPESYETDMEY